MQVIIVIGLVVHQHVHVYRMKEIATMTMIVQQAFLVEPTTVDRDLIQDLIVVFPVHAEMI